MNDLIVTRESLVEHVKSGLGWPTTCVELSASALEDAALEAELWIASHMGFTRVITVQIVGGISQYDMPSDCERVVSVAFSGRSRSLDFPFDLPGSQDYIFHQMWRGTGTMGLAQSNEIAQLFQSRDTFSRMIGTEQDFVWEPYHRKLHIQPTRVAGPAMVWYLSNKFDYDRLSTAQKMLLRKYALAYAKKVLGIIRSKFSDIPASGQRVTLNGSELIGDADSEMGLLDEKIKTLVPPIPFLTG